MPTFKIYRRATPELSVQ